jgi:hypothetical protein
MKFETRLDTRQASDFLTARGYKTAPATLNKKRCVGGGPEFELFGRRPLYKETALLEWAQARTTPPLRSTSDPAKSTAGDHSLLSNPSIRPSCGEPAEVHASPYRPHRVTAGGGDDASREFIGRRNRGGR